jgi:hypothetical protein
VIIISGGKFLLIKLPPGKLSVQDMLKILLESSFLNYIKITAGDERKNTINNPIVKRITRLKMKSPRTPFIFLHKMSEGSVVLDITITASSYF